MSHRGRESEDDDQEYLPTREVSKRVREEESDEGDIEGDDAPGEDDGNIFEDESMPIGKQYAPGGSLHDFFFSAAPRWTVGNALSRLLTKVKNSPSQSVTIQRFVKDSCKGNLKKFFNAIRAAMPNPDSVVMAEVAYHSFIQLTRGPSPYALVTPPKNRPRNRAAAVSEEGFAYKDYHVQVTASGFEVMQTKMAVLEGRPPGEHNGDASAEEPPAKRRRLSKPARPATIQVPIALPTTEPGFIPRILEQEQDAANNMLLFMKATTDGFLATIHHVRTDNDKLKKENSTLKFFNQTLVDDVRGAKLQLATMGLIQPYEIEPLFNHPELGVQKQAELAAAQHAAAAAAAASEEQVQLPLPQ
jgi:hypothetical protein